ncbi:50S ribosomal protein L6 [Thermogymnomonas acidicola]|uniref:Large ribosomal subunit protein uL6 n=1 Tax=Thermogymnomonas acidicola TaxID=399579 RepID=A0AA37BR47_9ARCH|nr:50S ribosomal protein L6 [Thermogymnomonas acidicola]GGM72068.1 50S ribosomal protein L6 [Thermogymnomonas acidicola]
MEIKWKEMFSLSPPQGVTFTVSDHTVEVKGKLGTVVRVFKDNYVRVVPDGNSIKIMVSKENRRNRGIAGTWYSEIRNAFRGVTEGFRYEMKIDYTHFPMRVSVRGNRVVIENFLGERSPRYADIVGNTKVSVKGDRVTLEGIDRRQLGETAANIERATKIKGFDLRVFQDGVYLISKGE